MQEMDRRVAMLRMLLADVADRERQTADAVRLLRGQLNRIVEFTIQRNGGVSNALATMAETEERLVQQEATLRHLAMLRKRAQSEIETLLVTRGIADARIRLTELQTRRAALVETLTQPANLEFADGGADRSSKLAEIDAEIAELKSLIEAASDAAARALTSGEPRPAPGAN